jgi:hypothetical protein
MLFTFQSATNGGLMMFEKNGKDILALLGKDPEDARGIITVEQLPAAISALQTALRADKARRPEKNSNASETEFADDQSVSQYRRAVPFIEMLERALKDREPVVWGV